jgi:hypothetical protein
VGLIFAAVANGNGSERLNAVFSLAVALAQSFKSA